MLPIVEERPGETVSLEEMPPDPTDDDAHAMCVRCYPHPRKGDFVQALCGYREPSFPGWTGKRGSAVTCVGCLLVIKGMARGACPH